MLSGATEMKEFPCALLSSYKIFCTAVNTITVVRSSCCPILTKFGFYRQRVSNKVKLTKIHSVGAALTLLDRQTDGEADTGFSLFTQTRLTRLHVVRSGGVVVRAYIIMI